MSSSATERLLQEHRESSLFSGTTASSSSSPPPSPALPSLNRMTSLHPVPPLTKKNLQHEKGDYYWANFESKWTLLDQKRLVSMDYLIHRSLEFHNNHHTFRASGNYDYSLEMPSPHGPELALEVQRFSAEGGTAPSSQLIHFGDIDNGDLKEIEVGNFGHIYWFNIKDIRCLPSLASYLRLSGMAVSLFYDLRGRSTIVALAKALFMSFCIMTLNGNDAELHKVYCYCTNTFLITFERELIVEPEEDSPARLFSTYRSPLSFDDYDNSPPNKAHSRDGGKSTQPHHESNISILSFLFLRMRTELYQQVRSLGTMYMLYEIGMESLSHSDTMIEFVSRTIFYLKQQVHKKLTYTQKLHFYRKVHILMAALHLADCLVDETSKNLEKIFNKNSAQFAALLQYQKFSEDHMAYISLLIDSYEFTSTCVERQIEDVRALENVMGHISAIRAEKISTNLTLIATVFLPITFLASAFGMNFEKHGDYTMEILNSPQGPNIFYAVCVAVVILNLVAFLHSGLVTIRDTEAIIRPTSASSAPSRLFSCFSRQEESRAGEDMHRLASVQSSQGVVDRGSLYSINSVPDNAKGTGLDRLDRTSIDDQSLLEEYRRQNLTKSRRTYEASKGNYGVA